MKVSRELFLPCRVNAHKACAGQHPAGRNHLGEYPAAECVCPCHVPKK
jgi:hypothetical protein